MMQKREFNDTFTVLIITISNEALCDTLIRDYFDYSSFNYSSHLIRDFDDIFTVFPFKFLMTYSSHLIRDLSLIRWEE